MTQVAGSEADHHVMPLPQLERCSHLLFEAIGNYASVLVASYQPRFTDLLEGLRRCAHNGQIRSG